MKWAVEITQTSLERRNLDDLLKDLGFRVVDGIDSIAFASPSFDLLDSSAGVWAEAKRVRDVLRGPASIDAKFTLGSVIDFGSGTPKRHRFLEAEPGCTVVAGGSATITISPPAGLSEEALAAWHSARAEREYQLRLESQRARLVPAFREPRASKVLELLQRKSHTGESLYRIYELIEGPPANRSQLHARFGISQRQFDRFRDCVHNPVVSGDLARHAYTSPPRTSDPMAIREAQDFVSSLAESWLSWIRST
jgi:hypothetical protein